MKIRSTVFLGKKMFSKDPILNKQNDRAMSFRNSICESCYISTNNNPASVMVLTVVESKRGKMSQAWFGREDQFTFADYREIIVIKVTQTLNK